MSTVDGNEYIDEYSDRSTPYSRSDPQTIRSENSYGRTASALESSISASAAPTATYSPAGETSYIGVSASATTPVGGAVLEIGGYSDSYGMVGAYSNVGTSLGIEGLCVGIGYGKTQSLAGDSISVSGSLNLPEPFSMISVSKSVSLDSSTLAVTGSQWSVALCVGPPVPGFSVAATYTEVSEFTSVYVAYVQFLNWAHYPQ